MAYPDFSKLASNVGQVPNAYTSAFNGYGVGDIPNTSQLFNEVYKGPNNWGNFKSMDMTPSAGANPYGGSALGPGPTNIMPVDGGGNWFKDSGILGSTDKNGMRADGWGGLALGAASGLMNGYLGMQMYGIAKDTLAANKEQFAKNYAAQRQTTNNAMEDLSRGRSGATDASVSDYMKSHKVN